MHIVFAHAQKVSVIFSVGVTQAVFQEQATIVDPNWTKKVQFSKFSIIQIKTTLCLLCLPMPKKFP